MPEIPDSPIVPDEYLREIGRTAVYWNNLESLLHHALILALLGDFSSDGRAVAVFAHMAFPQKLDALSSMLRIIDENLANIYREQVQPLLKGSQEKRNAVIHQMWFTQPDGVKRFDIKARGKLKYTIRPVTAQEVLEVSKYIAKAHSALLELIIIPLAPKSTPQQGQ